MNLENLFSAVAAEDADAILSLFHNGQADICLPSFGAVSNNRIFKMFLGKLSRKFRQLNVTASFTGQRKGEGILIAEYVLSYRFFDWERKKDILYDTPTAIVCPLAEDGKLAAMIVYTGMDKFVGKEILRPAFLNADDALWDQLPTAVAAAYKADRPDTLTEPCRVWAGPGWLAVEENVLMTQGAICTPQAQLSVFQLEQTGTVISRRVYGEIVWDFKLWPTLY